MKGFFQDIVIAVLAFVICLIIAIVTGANFLWLLLPIVIIILLAMLGNLLRQRYGSTYGVTAYLFLFFAVPLLWYLFCSQMPITALTLKTQQKAEDFSSFKNYEGSIDAKQQFVEYQLRQDSIVKLEVEKLLKDGRVDSALGLIKQSQINTDKIRNELFSNSDVTKDHSIINNTKTNDPKTVVVEFWANKKVSTGINVQGVTGEYLKFTPMKGRFEIQGTSGWEIVNQEVTLPSGHPGGLSIRGVTDGKVKIQHILPGN